MKVKNRIAIVAALALLLTVSLSLTTGPTGPTGPTTVVLTGQAAPGTNGGALASVSLPSINGLGDVAFRSEVAGFTVRNGIFLARGGSVSRIALFGELAPNGIT